MGYRVYVGRLSHDATKEDLEGLFKKYGKLLDVTVKTGFGFVEFSDKIDAEDAVHDINDTRFLGQRIVVELAMNRRRDDRRDDRRSDRQRSVPCDRQEHTSQDNLAAPFLLLWRFWKLNALPIFFFLGFHGMKDLKDYMKKAGHVAFADVLKGRNGEGVVEFSKREDMKYALRKLDDGRLNGQRISLHEPSRSSRSRRDRSSSRSRRNRSSSRSRRDRSSSPSRSRRDRSSSRHRNSSRSHRNRSSSRSRSPRRRSRHDRSKSRSVSRSPSPSRHSREDRREDRSRRRSESPVARSPRDEEEDLVREATPLEEEPIETAPESKRASSVDSRDE
ncbi:hypothetical protein J3Q64DRAFT_1704478 [Phycomyces blakesleeanus]|uniref:RRM domain-containing protein n=1 Tax=Phycomyces blakesleeanus TaxID=4837 RepID=A0ABR3AJL1_PHYBL